MFGGWRAGVPEPEDVETRPADRVVPSVVYLWKESDYGFPRHVSACLGMLRVRPVASS